MLERPNEILVSSREYFVLFAAIIAAVALLFNNDAPQIDALRSFFIDRYATLRAQTQWNSWLEYSPEEVAALRRRATQLMLENSQLREAFLENLRLRRMMEFRDRTSLAMRPARVLIRDKGNAPDAVVIDVGSADGMRMNMPVVTPEGLAGKLIKINRRTSHVQLLSDRNFSVSARVQGSRALGIVTWLSGKELEMTGVSPNAEVQPGDVVVCSDSSALFPPGIRIGVVQSTAVEPASLFMTIKVRPAVEFSYLEEVFVVLTPRARASGEHSTGTGG